MPGTSRGRTLYAGRQAADIEVEHATGLAMFKSTLAGFGDAPFIHYFTDSISRNEADGLSDALALALLELGVGRGTGSRSICRTFPEGVSRSV